MSLLQTITDGVATAFDAVGDLKRDATLNRAGGTYDPATGTTTGGSTEAIKVVEIEFSTLERATGAVQIGDVKLLIEAATLSAPIDNADTITHRGVTWGIVRPMNTQDALIELHCRRNA